MRRLILILALVFLTACAAETKNGVEKMDKMEVTSTAFTDNGNIPEKYTCDGQDINPPLNIKNIPDRTQTLVLIVDDPDAPAGTWVHWVIWNIPPRELIEENSIPGTEGINSFKKNHYGGPCPPSGTHRYFFKVYALDTTLDLGSDAKKEDVEGAMEGRILAKGELVGLYSRA